MQGETPKSGGVSGTGESTGKPIVKEVPEINIPPRHLLFDTPELTTPKIALIAPDLANNQEEEILSLSQ